MLWVDHIDWRQVWEDLGYATGRGIYCQTSSWLFSGSGNTPENTIIMLIVMRAHYMAKPSQNYIASSDVNTEFSLIIGLIFLFLQACVWSRDW